MISCANSRRLVWIPQLLISAVFAPNTLLRSSRSVMKRNARCDIRTARSCHDFQRYNRDSEVDLVILASCVVTASTYKVDKGLL